MRRLALVIAVAGALAIGSPAAADVAMKPPRPVPGTPCQPGFNPPAFRCVDGIWQQARPDAKANAKGSANAKGKGKGKGKGTTTSNGTSGTATVGGWSTGPSNTLFTSGTLTIGTGVSLTGPARGSVFACRLLAGDGSAGGNRQPWISGTTWTPGSKLKVQGSVAWSGQFTVTNSGALRVLAGNGLPVTSQTGTFPIARTDPARAYDGNPNSISQNAFSVQLPASPQVAASPSCLPGGQIGYSTNGVAIFNALDAANRDAAVYEVLDQCWGHPERNGKYHFHTMSSCVDEGGPKKDSPVWGYLLDGFPITGPWEGGRKLTNADLDECHGKASEITIDGARVRTYHYVATEEYPYTAGCFKGTPVSRN